MKVRTFYFFFCQPRVWVPLGGAALAGEGAVSQYSPDRRVIVSYVSRVTEGSPSALGGIALEGHVRHSASGLPPAEGE